MSTLQVKQERDSNFSSHCLSWGGAIVRNDVNAALDGENCTCDPERPLHGRRQAAGRQPHAGRAQQAQLLQPRALQGHPRGPGARRLHRPHLRREGRPEDRRRCRPTAISCSRTRRSATRSPSSRSSPTTCAAPMARRSASSTRPRSSTCVRRGIGEEAARSLLTYAFAADIVTRVKLPQVRRDLEEFLFRRLPKGDVVRQSRVTPHERTDATAEQSRRGFDAAARSRRQFPVLAPRGPRQAAGLSRQRRLGPEAAVRDRRRARLLPRALLERPPRRPLPLARRRPRPTRRRASKVARFIGAGCPREIVFVRGTTEGINLVASTFGRQRVGAGDEVLITAHGAPLEHRPLADALRRDGRQARRRAHQRARRARSATSSRAPHQRAHQDRRLRPRLERAGHHQPGRAR